MKPVPNFPDYFVDEQGNIYSMKSKHYQAKPKFPQKLTPSMDGRYLFVRIRKDGRNYNRRIHNLVLETFVSPRPKGMFGCHGIKGSLCNSVDNLYWATPKQNCADKWRDGTQQIGESSPNRKLNNLQVRIIKRAYSYKGRTGKRKIWGLCSTELGKIFDINSNSILDIVKRKTWKHLS